LTDALSQANKDMQEKHGKRFSMVKKITGDRFVYQNRMMLVSIPIPEGGIKCPDCGGAGELRIGWDGTHDQDYMECVLCSGKGYLVQEDIDMWNRIGSKHAKETMVKLKETDKK
jgi:hypothetical protein